MSTISDPSQSKRDRSFAQSRSGSSDRSYSKNSQVGFVSGSKSDVNRVPPHDLAAEESLLGAMLLNRDAVTAVTGIVHGDDFYRPSHSHIFEAIMGLVADSQPTDPVTVADTLRRADLLEAVGGASTLVGLQANTPAIGSAERYAKIVSDHAALRRLIAAAGEIAENAYHMPEDVAETIDRAESLVFEIGERRSAASVSPLSDELKKALDRLELLYERKESITGVPTGYLDLDELLAGMQPENLIVVGARPAMGKTAFALGMARNAAIEGNKAVLFCSLEMGTLELTQRLLAAEARVDAERMRTGKLQEADWGRINHAIGRLASAPIFLDDNPMLTVMELRAKARRLSSKLPNGLGLIIIDYLQLMTARRSSENRALEVGEMSRGLKILARELKVPVVALSQLSRNLESRNDKRPMLADLRESGCLAPQALITRADNGAQVAIGDLAASGERNIPVWSVGPTGSLVVANMTHAFSSGVKDTFSLRLSSGRTIQASANHPFLTKEGWRALGDLHEGVAVAVPSVIPDPISAGSAPVPPAQVSVTSAGSAPVASRHLLEGEESGLTKHELAKHELAKHELAKHEFARHEFARHELAKHELVLLAHLLSSSGSIACSMTAEGLEHCSSLQYKSQDLACMNDVEQAVRMFGVHPRRVWVDQSWALTIAPVSEMHAESEHPIVSWLQALGIDPFDSSATSRIPDIVFAQDSSRINLFLTEFARTDVTRTTCEMARDWVQTAPIELVQAQGLAHAHALTHAEAQEHATANSLLHAMTHVEVHDLNAVPVVACSSRTLAFDLQQLYVRTGQCLSVREVENSFVLFANATVSVDSPQLDLRDQNRLVFTPRREAPSFEKFPASVDVAVAPGVGDVVLSESSTQPADVRLAAAHSSEVGVSEDSIAAKACTDEISVVLNETKISNSTTREVQMAVSNGLLWDVVVGIDSLGAIEVFDATVEGTHNFIANGIVVHNSIEQDADVVMFLYRDEAYNPESTAKGMAEVLVAKHRNGPTGMVRLAFLNHHTAFANMARN